MNSLKFTVMFGLSSIAFANAIKSISSQASKEGITAIAVRLTSATRGIVTARDGSVHGFDVA